MQILRDTLNNILLRIGIYGLFFTVCALGFPGCSNYNNSHQEKAMTAKVKNIYIEYAEDSLVDSFFFRVNLQIKNDHSAINRLKLDNTFYLQVDSVLLPLIPAGLPNIVYIDSLSSSTSISLLTLKINNYLPDKRFSLFKPFYTRLTTHCDFKLISSNQNIFVINNITFPVTLMSYSDFRL